MSGTRSPAGFGDAGTCHLYHHHPVQLTHANMSDILHSPPHGNNYTTRNISNHYLAEIRQSLVQGLTTINEGGNNIDEDKLIELAAIAEENARTARQLADAAAKLVKSRIKYLHSSTNELTPQSGSSVDPPSFQHSPPRQEHYCTIL